MVRPSSPLRTRPPEELANASLSPDAAHWDAELGEFVLDWNDIRDAPDPPGLALEFARSAFTHSCEVRAWDPVLAQSAEGIPPPVN